MDVRDRVDPAFRELVEAAAANPVDWSDPVKVRADRAALLPPPPIPDGIDWADHEAPGPVGSLAEGGPDGAPTVTVRTYRASGHAQVQPAIYWIHGGGYIAGTYEGNNDTASEWARDLGAVVTSVDYRLAPEHPYPAPIEDCYAGLNWLTENADTLGIDPNRIVIAGGSAGAGLAAALALLVRDRGELNVTHQVLIYPMIDDTRSTPSSQWTTWGWSPESNNIGWRYYLGDRFGTADIPSYAAPTRATDLSNLPPAYIAVGSIDIFLDEDIAYARRLTEAGVPTEFKIYPGGPHGFDNPRLGGATELGQRAHADTADYLRRALASTAPY